MMLLTACPHCNGKHIIKHGKFNDIQRYKCKNPTCLKTFSNVTNTEFYYSKKAKFYLGEYAKLMYKRLSLRAIVHLMKLLHMSISLKTAFLWRHKLLNILENTNNNYLLKGFVETITFKNKENYKGCRNIKKKTRDFVYTFVNFDSMKRSHPSIVSIGRITYPLVKVKLEELLEKDVFLLHSNGIAGAFLSVFKKHHSPPLEIPEPNEFLQHNIYGILKKWLSIFRGVQTKNLEKYLGWFILEYKSHIM